MLGKLLAREGIDKKLAIIIMVVGAAVLVLALTVFPSLLFMQAAATLLLASGIYLFLRWRRRKAVDEEVITEQKDVPRLHPSYGKLLDIAFWGLFIASLMLISQEVYARPLSFLIVVSVMAGILAVQIWAGKSVTYCLTKIFIIGVLLRASAWFQFPSPVGYDAVWETSSLEQLVANGHTGSFMLGYQYYPVAFYLSASTFLVTGMEAMGSQFMLGVIEVISLVFLFLVGRRLFNERIGLLAVLVVAVFDWHVFWGFYVKAMTLGIALLPILLFLLLVSRQKNRLLLSLLIILFMFLIVLTHTFATAALFVILFTGWLLFLVVRNIQKDGFRQPVTWNMVLLLGCATLGYWMYVSGFYLYIAQAINYALSLDVGQVEALTLPTDTAEVIWSRLPIFVLIFFATVGCLSVFNVRKWDSKAAYQVWLALLCGALVIVNFIIFYLPELGSLVRERWFVFTGLIAAIPAAVGLVSLAARKGWPSLAGVFLLVFVLSGVMTTSYIGSVDSVIPWGPQTHNAATSSELAAAGTVGQITGLPAEDIMIYADHYYSQIFLLDVQLLGSRVVDFSELRKEALEEYHGILMLRTSVINIVSAHDEVIMDQSRYQSLMSDPEVSLIYDSGTVKGLSRP